MSLPTFPSISPPLTTKDSLNMILTSVAMEELALSHILNAEGEKLQYVLGTLDGCQNKKANNEEILAVNKSIKSMLDSISQNQMILKSKMECAVEALKECGYCKAGPAKPDCDFCRAAGFLGCPDQCWKAGQPLKWKHSKRPKCDSFCLSDDCEKIRLEKNKCYSVSFSINLGPTDCKNLSISVRTCGCDTLDRFVFNAPVYECKTFTASAGGIFIEICNCNCPVDLMLTLLSPDTVKASQASIFVTELF